MPTSPRDLTGRNGRYKRAAQLSNLRDDEGIVPYAVGKNVPCNQVRQNISGVPYTPAGGSLPLRGRWHAEGVTDEGGFLRRGFFYLPLGEGAAAAADEGRYQVGSAYRPTPVRASPCHPLPGEGLAPHPARAAPGPP